MAANFGNFVAFFGRDKVISFNFYLCAILLAVRTDRRAHR